jgi:hypothetical protein
VSTTFNAAEGASNVIHLGVICEAPP